LAFHDNNISLFTDEIQNTLNVPTAALSGANIADEVAQEMFCETTIGSQTYEEDGELWFKVLLFVGMLTVEAVYILPHLKTNTVGIPFSFSILPISA
jgi:hypothetical protein